LKDRTAVDPRNLANPTPGQLLPARLVRSFVPGTGSQLNGLALPDEPAAPKGYRHTAAIDWEPRVGFAWDIFGGGQTVLRAVGGVYHAPRIGGGTEAPVVWATIHHSSALSPSKTATLRGIAHLVGTALLFPTTLNGPG